MREWSSMPSRASFGGNAETRSSSPFFRRSHLTSHWHWDHTGDPSLFPTTTDLIVGPGFKDKFVPGYPTKPESGVDESAWQ